LSDSYYNNNPGENARETWETKELADAAAIAKYPYKHTEGILWIATWLIACGNKQKSYRLFNL